MFFGSLVSVFILHFQTYSQLQEILFLSWQGQNGLIEYYILPDPTVSPFFLIEDLSEGKIITTGNLSRSGEMHLTVMAKDKGSPPLNGTAMVTLSVFDNRPFIPHFNTSEIR